MNSLVADYGSDSDSQNSSDSSSTDKSTEETTGTDKKSAETPGKLILPKPDFVLNSSNSATVKNSVFSNPYREAEDEKSALLEKHVKMIPSKDEIKAINGKSICWMYRKGRCRFGHNCKYAHDSDVELSSLNELTESDNKPAVNLAVPNDSHLNDIPEEVDSARSNAKRKRPGLSQTLVPGKKVMKIYNQQKRKK